MLDLWFHESDFIFLDYPQHGAVVFETHHSMILGSNHQWSIHGDLWPKQDIEHSIVHWQVVLWCVPKDLWSECCKAYVLTIYMDPSFNWIVTWATVSFTGCILYKWNLVGQVHLNLSILCSLPNYYSLFCYPLILALLFILWNKEQHVEIERHVWQAPIICLQLKVSKSEVFPHHVLVTFVYRGLYIQLCISHDSVSTSIRMREQQLSFS